MSAALLSRAFRVGVFRFTLVPRETLFVPAVNKANMLRGAFGHAFRRLCCVPQCLNAYECPLASSCPYKLIFEPSPPEDAERLSKNRDVPRPFVFRAPTDLKTKFGTGDEFEFGLVLIGNPLDHLPYFVLSFRDLASQGLGLNRAKCELRSVREETFSRVGEGHGPSRPVYDSSDQVFYTPQGLHLDHWIRHRMSALSGNGQVTLRFLTPTLLKAEDSVQRRPDFHHVLKRLRDRVNALSTFFGSGPLDLDFAGFGTRAEQVRTVSCNVQWENRFRTSSKTRQRHTLSGFIGEAVYEGALNEFLPWLVMGELVHLGKHTAWGMGQISLTPSE